MEWLASSAMGNKASVRKQDRRRGPGTQDDFGVFPLSGRTLLGQITSATGKAVDRMNLANSVSAEGGTRPTAPAISDLALVRRGALTLLIQVCMVTLNKEV